MMDPQVELDFRKYRFKYDNRTFFKYTDAYQWSFIRFYHFSLHSRDTPKTFNEITHRWIADLNYIKKHASVPSPVKDFAGALLEYDKVVYFYFLFFFLN